MLTDNELMH